MISGLLGGISTRDLVEQYAREGREAVVGKLDRVKSFFAAFDGWLGVEERAAEAAAALAAATAKRESEGGGSSTATPPATVASSSLVVVGWWEA